MARPLSNIINNSIRKNSAERNSGNWVLPATNESEIAFALKCTKKQNKNDFKQTLNALISIGKERKWINEDDLKEIALNTGSPVRYLKHSVSRLNSWLTVLDSYVKQFGDGLQVQRLERNIPTSIILAGDEISLAGWTITHAMLSNANAIVKPSSTEPLTAYLFVKAILEKGLNAPNLLYIDGSTEDGKQGIRKIVSGTDQSVVFGEDETIDAVYHGLNLHDCHKQIKYWSGRSGAIILRDADLEKSAWAVIMGATEDRGNRCVSTKKLFAPIEMAERLEALLKKYADGLSRGDLLTDSVEIGLLSNEARQLALQKSAGDNVIYDNGLIIARCNQNSYIIKEELPYPILGICYYSDEDPIAMANDSVRHSRLKKALAMSVFTSDMGMFKSAAYRLSCHKALMNLPTTYMDFHKMHQGIHLWMELMRPKETCL